MSTSDLAADAHREDEIGRLQAQVRELETQLRATAIGVSSATGREFFRLLVQHLATSLQCEYALVGVLRPGDSERIAALAVFGEGQWLEDWEYDLCGTPCEHVCRQDFCLHAAGVQQSFPADRMLQTLAIESYAGMPLPGAHGDVLGLIAVFSRRPLPPAERVRPALQIFAARAAAEIERQRAEEAVQASESRLRLALLAGKVATGDWDLATQQATWSDGMRELLGLSPNDPADAHEIFRQCIHPDDLVLLEQNMQDAIAGTRPYHAEFRLRDVRGNLRWMLTQGEILRDAYGNPTRLLGTVLDITQQKDAESRQGELRAELQHLLHQQRMILERMPIGCILMDDQMRFTHFNAEAEKIFGFPRAEVLGRLPAETIVPPEYYGDVKARFEQMRAGDTAAHGYNENLTRDGRRIFCHWHNTPLFDESGKLYAFLSMATDVTDQLRAAEERESLIEQLEQKNVELERFTYTVSHDLKSPLITISGFAGALAADLAAGKAFEVQDDLQEIIAAAQRMQRLLDELLELSRIGRTASPVEDVSFGELAYQALRSVHGRMVDRPFQVEIAADLPVVRGDPGRLLEVVQNLLDNAIKFSASASSPRIEVGWQSSSNEFQFHVRDNGIGIEPQYLERVFGLFEQLDPRMGGTGIGLAIAKRIVEVHGGRIWALSEGLGQGTTICFTLPRDVGEGKRSDDEPARTDYLAR